MSFGLTLNILRPLFKKWETKFKTSENMTCVITLDLLDGFQNWFSCEGDFWYYNLWLHSAHELKVHVHRRCVKPRSHGAHGSVTVKNDQEDVIYCSMQNRPKSGVASITNRNSLKFAKIQQT